MKLQLSFGNRQNLEFVPPPSLLPEVTTLYQGHGWFGKDLVALMKLGPDRWSVVDRAMIMTQARKIVRDNVPADGEPDVMWDIEAFPASLMQPVSAGYAQWRFDRLYPGISFPHISCGIRVEADVEYQQVLMGVHREMYDMVKAWNPRARVFWYGRYPVMTRQRDSLDPKYQALLAEHLDHFYWFRGCTDVVAPVLYTGAVYSPSVFDDDVARYINHAREVHREMQPIVSPAFFLPGQAPMEMPLGTFMGQLVNMHTLGVKRATVWCDTAWDWFNESYLHDLETCIEREGI